MAETGISPKKPYDQELLDLLRLTLIPGVGPCMREALLERFGTPAAVLAAAPSDLRAVKGVGPKLLDKIGRAKTEIDPLAVIEQCRQQGVGIISL
ncbi:MAG: helix-hairpin-helix domain-containing protein, partial [Thermoguttaceae bacterium]